VAGVVVKANSLPLFLCVASISIDYQFDVMWNRTQDILPHNLIFVSSL
jgi:hypothetical protein